MSSRPPSPLPSAPSAEQYKAALNELGELQRRYGALVELERNRTLDYKEALARLDQARLHLDEARDYYLDRMGRSNWSVFWLCLACFLFGGSLTLLGLLAFGARLPGVA